MEAMVNSDNVVRGGLTPKFKDTKTLVEMLKYEFKERKQNTGEEVFSQGATRIVLYKTGYAEFMITKLTIGASDQVQTAQLHYNSLSIAIVLSGNAVAHLDNGQTVLMEDKGCYFILPEQKFTVTKDAGMDNLLVFICSCDI